MLGVYFDLLDQTSVCFDRLDQKWMFFDCAAQFEKCNAIWKLVERNQKYWLKLIKIHLKKNWSQEKMISSRFKINSDQFFWNFELI